MITYDCGPPIQTVIGSIVIDMAGLQKIIDSLVSTEVVHQHSLRTLSPFQDGNYFYRDDKDGPNTECWP